MAFQYASSLEDLPPNSMRAVPLASTPVLLVREGDQVYALEPRCGHMGGPLPEGTLQGHIVTCPWHGSQYDVRTGRAIRGPYRIPGVSRLLTGLARRARRTRRGSWGRASRSILTPLRAHPPDEPLAFHNVINGPILTSPDGVPRAGPCVRPHAADAPRRIKQHRDEREGMQISGDLVVMARHSAYADGRLCGRPDGPGRAACG